MELSLVARKNQDNPAYARTIEQMMMLWRSEKNRRMGFDGKHQTSAYFDTGGVSPGEIIPPTDPLRVAKGTNGMWTRSNLIYVPWLDQKGRKTTTLSLRELISSTCLTQE